MIPRNVLSCWFGRGEKSELFKRCRESKERILAGWNFIDVNEDNCAMMHMPYMKAVHERGEFVKCTELGRLWALCVYGGVYMDEDVEAVKPFDPLLDRQFFIGREDDRWVNGAVMGSKQMAMTAVQLLGGFPVDSDGRELANVYGPKYLTAKLAEIGFTDILPPEYFYPYSFGQTRKQAVITPNTYAMHHWAGSWIGKY